MNSGMHGISEDALMMFVTAVILVTFAVAFVAYVGTWISARRRDRADRDLGQDSLVRRVDQRILGNNGADRFS
jgi:archaellum component FlaG (FlaF/FlaG flagellin family)